jgi:hypothetical protein
MSVSPTDSLRKFLHVGRVRVERGCAAHRETDNEQDLARDTASTRAADGGLLRRDDCVAVKSSVSCRLRRIATRSAPAPAPMRNGIRQPHALSLLGREKSLLKKKQDDNRRRAVRR